MQHFSCEIDYTRDGNAPITVIVHVRRLTFGNGTKELTLVAIYSDALLPYRDAL